MDFLTIYIIELMKKYPDKDEGFLTKAKAQIVSGPTLASHIDALGIVLFVMHGAGKASAEVIESAKVKEDVFESITGAIMQDGGLEKAVEFVKRHLKDVLEKDYSVKSNTDFKSGLLETVTKRGGECHFESLPTDDNFPPEGYIAKVYIDGEIFGTGKGKPIANRPLPIVAVTTTAGTGSETDAGGVITNAETREKTALFDEALFPVLAVVDPELTKTVPAKFTAFQGFDALFHSTEACISRRANLMSDMYALTAIEHIAKHLPRAVRDGNDIEARTHVSWGNTLSGSVMCVGSCTSEHSLEHALSAFHQELPHGAGLIMISQAYYAHFIRLGVRSERFVKMAKAMGVEDASVPEDFLRALEKLRNDCGVGDLKMSDYGITPDEFPKMARNAKDSMGFLFPADPAPLSDEDCVAIYRASYK